MNKLQIVEKKINEITSLELLEQINIFRKQENKKEQSHSDLLKIIRDEFEDEIAEGKISLGSYKDKNNQSRPLYIMNLSQARQLLVRESKFVRKAVIKWIDGLEKKLNDPYYQLSQSVVFANNLIEQREKEIKELTYKVEVIEKELEYKNEIITGITENIDLYQKRKILGRVVKHKGANYRERWNELYKCFRETHHIDLKARMQGYNAAQIKRKDECKSILDYADKFGHIDDLYKIALKLYETDMEEIIENIKRVA
jgi:hypothetical protein|nr:MAG TPA: KilAC domain protein [Caudoviricetes sp.]